MFIPSPERLVTSFRISGSAELGSESEDKGDARSRTKKAP
jgi:hypothetical protein